MKDNLIGTKAIAQQTPEQWSQAIAQASLSRAKGKGLAKAISQQNPKQWSQAIAKAKLSKPEKKPGQSLDIKNLQEF